MTGNALMRGDIFGCVRCVLAFAFLLFAPGNCVGFASDLLGFRRRTITQQIAWSVALSFAITPIVAVMFGKYASSAIGLWVLMACAACCIACNIWWQRGERSTVPPAATAIGVIWVGFVIASLIDVAIGNRLYLSVTVFDHALRSAFVDSAMRTGVPPANPLYFPGHAAPMRYYYFWYVVTAGAARLAKATARQATIASVVWAGFGLASIVALFCKHFLPGEGPRPDRRLPRLAVALWLLAVTGLDLIPAIVKALLRMPTDADMEWWSGDQVSSWMDSLLWVPHHIAGLVCCLLGFLLVWMSRNEDAKQRWLCAAVAGVSFASAFGLSTWVTIAFALVMLAWFFWVLIAERTSVGRLPVLLGAGLTASLLLGPYLRELSSEPAANTMPSGGRGTIAGGASHLLHFGIRQIIDLGGSASLSGDYSARHILGTAIQILLLLPGYFVELGFFGLVLVLAWRASRRPGADEALRTSVFLTTAMLGIVSFLRSAVVGNNDFGWRASLIAQFFLLMLAVLWWEGAFEPVNRKMRLAMLAMLWIGIAGSMYQAVELRVYLPFEDALGRPDQRGLAEHALALRQAGDAMAVRLPASAVVQFNTAQPSDYFRYAQVLYAARQIVTAFPGCVPEFGGTRDACPGIQSSVARLFVPVAGAALPAQQARAECARMAATDLIATRWDGVWFDRNGWVWTLPAVVQNKDVRVLDCSH